MGCRQPRGNLRGVVEGRRKTQAVRTDQAAERIALHVLHGDVVDIVDGFDSVDRNNVGVVESRGRLGFQNQAGAPPGVKVIASGQSLESDHSAEAGVAGTVHDTHAPLAELFENLVVRNGTANHGFGQGGRSGLFAGFNCRRSLRGRSGVRWARSRWYSDRTCNPGRRACCIEPKSCRLADVLPLCRTP